MRSEEAECSVLIESTIFRSRRDDVTNRASLSREILTERAQRFLDAHHHTTPVLLANAWDVASARAVEAAGFEYVATSSRAVAQVLGENDDDSSDPDLIFPFLSRIALSITLPVSADLEAGYALAPHELVARILESGVIGCNLEDTDHHGDGVLLDAEEHAGYLRDVRTASERMGVHLVLNARTDSYLHQVGDEATQLKESIRRGRLYLEAGVDCVYPIAVTRPEHVETLVASVPGPLNFLSRRDGLSIDDLTRLGASRISLAAEMFRLTYDRLVEILSALKRGTNLDGV